MKIVFVGASTFGFDCLLTISELKEVTVAGVISNNQKFSISYRTEGVENVLYQDFEQYCKQESVPFYRMADNMKEEGLKQFLNEIAPELVIVIGWYHMIPASLLKEYPFTGIHASLLPDYSGGAPLVWAIINGEKKTGISYFYFDEGVDSGDIIAQTEIEINGTDTIKTVYEKATEEAKRILRKFLPLMATGTAPRSPQDNSKRRVYPQRSPKDGEIDWTWDAERIKDFIRAQTKPYPGAWTIIHGKKVTIWGADIEDV